MELCWNTPLTLKHELLCSQRRTLSPRTLNPGALGPRLHVSCLRMPLSRFAPKQSVTFMKVAEIMEAQWNRPTLVTRIVTSTGDDVEVQSCNEALDERRKLQPGVAYVVTIPGTVVKAYTAGDKSGTQLLALHFSPKVPGG